jgi:Niemann-Pick C1 protein
MYATAVFFFGWLLQVTFFYACLVIDEKRIARSADCVTCCFTVTSNVDVEKQDPSSFKTDTAVQRAFGRYADVLLKPVVSLAVVLLFFGVASVASGLVSNISIGLPLEDILPDDSSVRDAFATEKEIFKGRATSVTSVVQGEDFNQLEARQRFRNAIGGVGQVENAVVELPNWMDAYEAWQGGSDTGSYLKGMQTFLGSKQGARWKSHVTCPDITCTSIATAKFDVLFMLSRPGTTQMDELQTRDNIDDVLNPIYPAGNVVVHSPPFMFAETDLAIWRAVLETIGFSLIGVFCVVCLSTSMSTAALITLTVAMIDVDLLLFAYALGLRLNSVSYTCLVMACGLAVDYCVHLGHAFDHSKKDGKDGALSNKAAARHAVAQMGASIFQGGMTTLLGVIVLAGASSVIFRTFFFFVFATVLLGVAHGLVLLPILLTYLTPTCGKAS